MITTTSISVLTTDYIQLIPITSDVEYAVAESKIENGMVTVVSKHTTTGVIVNESLECLESDIQQFLERCAPEDHPYAHARVLKEYGSTAGNPTGHLKSLLTGNHCHLMVQEGRIVRGGAQEVYFCEFDGPSERTVLIQISGER